MSPKIKRNEMPKLDRIEEVDKSWFTKNYEAILRMNNPQVVATRNGMRVVDTGKAKPKTRKQKLQEKINENRGKGKPTPKMRRGHTANEIQW